MQPRSHRYWIALQMKSSRPHGAPTLRPRTVTLAAIALLACGGGTSGESGVDTLSAQVSSRERGDRGDTVNQEIEQSRSTAIVQAAQRVSPAVVSINVLRRERIQPRSFFDAFYLPRGASRTVAGLGSGFVFDGSGLVLTNQHVVRGADRIMVTLPDGRDMEAELLGGDELTDIAVLGVPAGPDLPVAPIGTSRGLMIGEWALAIGNPFGQLLSNPEPTVTAGVVSALGRHIVPDQDDPGFYLGMIQTDAAINPGNSGGPLVNALGQVVGVNTSIFSRSGGSEGLGFAIPIDRALRVAADLVRGGEVDRAWLGIDVQPVEADEWGRTRGVQIVSVAPGSPAARAGLRAGPRVTRLNDVVLAGPLDFQAALLDLRAGDAADLVLEGRSAPVRLVAESLPSRAAARVTVLTELELVTLTPEIRAERRIASRQGALVVTVTDAIREQLGFREGDVIVRINGVPVGTAQGASAILDELRRRRGRVRIEFERRGAYDMREFVWR